MKNLPHNRQPAFSRTDSGQVLVTLLFFTIFAVTIATAAIIGVLSNSTATSATQQGLYAESIAESGMENALLRLLRNPNYTGETMSVDTGSATITVTGSSTKTITSVGKAGNFLKKIRSQVVYTGGVLTISSWQETY